MVIEIKRPKGYFQIEIIINVLALFKSMFEPSLNGGCVSSVGTSSHSFHKMRYLKVNQAKQQVQCQRNVGNCDIKHIL